MISDIGHGALAVGTVLAVYGSIASGVGARTGRPALIESAQFAALAVFTLVTGCLLLLSYAFLTFDFSVRYVAQQTNLSTPFYYRITAVWGALEGSILLWTWMVTLYTLLVVLRHRPSAQRAEIGAGPSATCIRGCCRSCSASPPSFCS